MDAEEAWRLTTNVIRHVDGGCPNCTYRAAENLNETFPEHDWVAMLDTAEDMWERDGLIPIGVPERFT